MRTLLAACVIAFAPAAASAQEADGASARIDEIVISSAAFERPGGRVAANMAAGDNNQQANGLVIASAPTALATILISQSAGNNSVVTASGGSAATLRILDGAFANAAGAIAVNAAAGADNQQANAAAIATGLEGQTLAVAALEQSRAPIEPEGDSVQAGAPRSVEVSATAFENASGLVQTNLTAGERNSSANSFALTLPGGAGQ